MTRFTLYTPSSTKQVLDEGVQSIMGGRLSRHEAITAIVEAGVAHADAALQQLRDQLRRDLGT